MRIQVAVYLHRDTKKWFADYGKRLRMTQSEDCPRPDRTGARNRVVAMGAKNPRSSSKGAQASEGASEPITSAH